MGKSITNDHKKLRIPLPVGGIQVNFCKNPECANFGVPASQYPPDAKAAKAATDKLGKDYIRRGGGRKYPVLHCKLCKENPPIKSNQGIYEEFQRIIEPITASAVTCPNKNCKNHTVPLDLSRGSTYRKNGRTASNTQRILCLLCKTTFSLQPIRTRATHDLKQSARILTLLTNKVPFRRIIYMEDISSQTFYDKLNFLYLKCQAFAAEHEKKMMSPNFSLSRLYLSSDRQEYGVNWVSRKERKSVMLQAIGTADNDSGYVFGMHLNYDGRINARELEERLDLPAWAAIPAPFRPFARIWLPHEYEVKRGKGVKEAGKPGVSSREELEQYIESAYGEAILRGEDVESGDPIYRDTQAPFKGAQIHSEYTLYGHFFYLRELVANVEKLRFYVDQDSGMRAACLGAFVDRIKQRTVDAWYVRINRDMTIDEKQKETHRAKELFKMMCKARSDLTPEQVKVILMLNRMRFGRSLGQWGDRRVYHPVPDMSEPQKATCYLTDYGDYSEAHLGRLFVNATLHGIDRFFMQTRRMTSMLERPITTASSNRRVWYGYAAYNPDSIVKLLEIFRVIYNYTRVGKGKQTPAMRLGLNSRPVKPSDIVRFSNKRHSGI